MRPSRAVWLLLAAMLLFAAVVSWGPESTQPRAAATGAAEPQPQDPSALAPDFTPAAESRADTPRRRNARGQALPFREAALEPGAFAAIHAARPGNVVSLAPFADRAFELEVTGRWEDGDNVRLAAGVRGQPAGDRFFLEWVPDGGRALLELPSQNLAWEFVPGPDGPVVREWLFTDVVCATPRPSETSADRGIPRPRSEAARSVVARIAPGDVPILNSRPGTTGVIYLDFDGETVTGSAWAGGATIVAASARMNASQVRETWERVSRDFENFTVNVTTDRAVYDAAPSTRRTHCVITATDTAAPGAGGVAYVGSFTESGGTRKVCWAFIDNNAKNSAEVISHEVGHTLGLNHDGRIASGGQPRDEYFEGHGSGPTGWAPIMGVGYYRELVQWSRGEYPRANNPEDDLAIISDATRAPYPADDHGNSIALATAVTGDRATGLVERNTDTDFFSVTLPAGSYTLVLQPSAFSNLKSELQVLRSNSTQIAFGSQTGLLSASATFTLASPETVYLRVRGTGEGDLAATGFSSYGSLGTYGITGFGNQEQPPSAPIGLGTSRVSGTQMRVTWTPNPSATGYQIYRDGALIGTTAGTEFLDTSVRPSTEYSYAVVALNAFGASPASAPTVATTPAADEFIMDGSPDFTGYLVSNPSMTIYAAVRGTKLYVATWSPGDNGSGFGSDHHIFISDTLLPSATTAAPWAKRGLLAIPGTKPYLAGESASTYAGWFNAPALRSLFKAPVNSGVMEGVIDLAAAFGTVPSEVYVASVAYQTDDAGLNPPNSGKINAQAPAGNGNDNLEPAEFLRIPVPQVADAAQNGTYDVLAPDRAFRISGAARDASRRPVLQWRTVPGRAYNLQRRSALDAGAWTNVFASPQAAGATQWEMTHTDTNAAPDAALFYRVTRP